MARQSVQRTPQTTQPRVEPRVTLGTVSKLEIHPGVTYDLYELHLKEAPNHIFLGSCKPGDPTVRHLKVGNRVRVDFHLNRHAVAVHEVTRLRKQTLIEVVKKPLLGRV